LRGAVAGGNDTSDEERGQRSEAEDIGLRCRALVGVDLGSDEALRRLLTKTRDTSQQGREAAIADEHLSVAGNVDTLTRQSTMRNLGLSCGERVGDLSQDIVGPSRREGLAGVVLPAQQLEEAHAVDVLASDVKAPIADLTESDCLDDVAVVELASKTKVISERFEVSRFGEERGGDVPEYHFFLRVQIGGEKDTAAEVVLERCFDSEASANGGPGLEQSDSPSTAVGSPKGNDSNLKLVSIAEAIVDRRRGCFKVSLRLSSLVLCSTRILAPEGIGSEVSNLWYLRAIVRDALQPVTGERRSDLTDGVQELHSKERALP